MLKTNEEILLTIQVRQSLGDIHNSFREPNDVIRLPLVNDFSEDGFLEGKGFRTHAPKIQKSPKI